MNDPDPSCLMTHNVMTESDRVTTRYSLIYCHDETDGKDISIDLDIDPAAVHFRVNGETLATVQDGVVTGDAAAALIAVAHAANIWRESLNQPIETAAAGDVVWSVNGVELDRLETDTNMAASDDHVPQPES